MDVEVVQTFSFPELKEMLRTIPLLGLKADDGSDILVYKNASFELREFSADCLNFTTNYLLSGNLQFQEEFRRHLRENFSIDHLRLTQEVAGFVTLNSKGEKWTVIPPVIELIPEKVKYACSEGEISYENVVVKVFIPALIDGGHRAMVAKMAGDGFNGVFIAGSDLRFPVPVHPNELERINIVESVPAASERKFYTMLDCYKLYRDFSVIGCGGPRNR